MAVGYSLGGLINDLYKLVYPIGICVDFWDATNPNILFPGTTWTLIDDGRFVRSSNTIAVGNVAGQIGSLGGSDTATLSIANMPNHNHDINHNHTATHTHGQGWTSGAGGHNHSFSANTSTNGSHQHHFISLTQFNGAGATPAAVYAGAQRDSHTDAAGDHYHSISGVTGGVGDHGHTVGTPEWAGNTGYAQNAYNGTYCAPVGGGTAFNIENRYRCYGRWRRTA